MAETVTMIADGLPELLYQLPFAVPEEVSDLGRASGATLALLMRDAVRGINSIYEVRPDEAEQEEIANQIASSYRLDEDPEFPNRFKGGRLLHVGESAVMVTTSVGYFDMAEAESEQTNWQYKETHKVIIAAPLPDIQNGGFAMLLQAHSIGEAPDSESSVRQVKAAWEIRAPRLSALSAFGATEHGMITTVSREGTMVDQCLGRSRLNLFTDREVIRGLLSAGIDLRVRHDFLGLIAGNELHDADRNRAIGVGIAVLNAAKPAQDANPTLFKAVALENI